MEAIAFIYNAAFLFKPTIFIYPVDCWFIDLRRCMNPVVILEIVNGLLDVSNELLKRLPNYDQKLRKKLFKLQIELFEETQKEYGAGPDCRDEAKVFHIMNELNLMIKIHKKELGIES